MCSLIDQLSHEWANRANSSSCAFYMAVSIVMMTDLGKWIGGFAVRVPSGWMIDRLENSKQHHRTRERGPLHYLVELKDCAGKK